MKILFTVLALICVPFCTCFGQCTVVANNGSYLLNVYLNPVQINPVQNNCNSGYSFNVAVNYVITATGNYSNGDILNIDGELYCYGASGVGVFVLPKDTVSGQVITTNFSTNSTNCATDTPDDLLCDGFLLNINAKQVSAQQVFCVPAYPLSTSLIDVNIEKINRGLTFSWVTALEMNTKSYLVEHLYDEEDWRVLEEIPAQGSSETNTYYHSELERATSGMHYFKLSEIDLNGDTTFLKVMSYNYSGANAQPYPNPSNTGIFNFDITTEKLNDFNLYTAAGVKIEYSAFNLYQSNSSLKIELLSLNKGVYFLKDDNGNCYRLVYL